MWCAVIETLKKAFNYRPSVIAPTFSALRAQLLDIIIMMNISKRKQISILADDVTIFKFIPAIIGSDDLIAKHNTQFSN